MGVGWRMAWECIKLACGQPELMASLGRKLGLLASKQANETPAPSLNVLQDSDSEWSRPS